MGGFRPEGPLCQVAQWFSDPIDPGTLALTAIPRPGTVAPATSPVQKSIPEAVQGWPSILDWSHFKQVSSAPDGSHEDAQTATNQLSIDSIEVERDAKGFRLGPFTLPIALNEDDCWVVQGKAAPPLLRHEQVHWDIAGLIAYECSRAFKALRVGRRQALGPMANAVLNRVAIKGQALQDWYDDESKHGLNASGQKAWEDRVAECIRNHYSALPTPPKKYLDQAKREQTQIH
jgi:hypothetical protein